MSQPVGARVHVNNVCVRARAHVRLVYTAYTATLILLNQRFLMECRFFSAGHSTGTGCECVLSLKK